jgi:hypothetical protein
MATRRAKCVALLRGINVGGKNVIAKDDLRRCFGDIGYSDVTTYIQSGNMCVGTWKGALVVRLDKEKHDETQAERCAKPMDITGKVMKGWALVQPAGIKSDDDLKAWVGRAAKFAASLPAKV